MGMMVSLVIQLLDVFLAKTQFYHPLFSFSTCLFLLSILPQQTHFVPSPSIPFVVIDEKESNMSTCVQRGYLALLGDATSDALLREAGVGQARCVLVATDDDAHNISVTLSARHLKND